MAEKRPRLRPLNVARGPGAAHPGLRRPDGHGRARHAPVLDAAGSHRHRRHAAPVPPQSPHRRRPLRGRASASRRAWRQVDAARAPRAARGRGVRQAGQALPPARRPPGAGPRGARVPHRQQTPGAAPLAPRPLPVSQNRRRLQLSPTSRPCGSRCSALHSRPTSSPRAAASSSPASPVAGRLTSPQAGHAVLHDDDLAQAIIDRVLDRGRLSASTAPRCAPKHLGLDDPTAAEAASTQAVRISGTHNSSGGTQHT